MSGATRDLNAQTTSQECSRGLPGMAGVPGTQAALGVARKLVRHPIRGSLEDHGVDFRFTHGSLSPCTGAALGGGLGFDFGPDYTGHLDQPRFGFPSGE